METTNVQEVLKYDQWWIIFQWGVATLVVEFEISDTFISIHLFGLSWHKYQEMVMTPSDNSGEFILNGNSESGRLHLWS